MLVGRGENLLILKYDGSIEFSGIENTLDKPIEKLRRMVFFAGRGGGVSVNSVFSNFR